ncbi:group II intron reverse transcriptase/maturase [Cardinium endosymbiont of Sogatella furcifera]|nr:group II intron reverse transcriptase/maturase [Cardinium endosymbiont of Sogatella furcifera]
MSALRKHTDKEWILLYVERWLKAPMIREGILSERTQGTPQGGVIGPLLANLFLHYAFDLWMKRTFLGVEFCRYADDGLVHCKTKKQAEYIKERFTKRFKECGLELNENKTRIVYCKDKLRVQDYSIISFDFLGYTFRPRLSYSTSKEEFFVNFSPAVSKASIKAMSQEMRRWKLNLRSSQFLEDFSRMYNPVLRGWWHYYGFFYKIERLKQDLRCAKKVLVLRLLLLKKIIVVTLIPMIRIDLDVVAINDHGAGPSGVKRNLKF